VKIISEKDGIYQFEDDEIRIIRNVIIQHFNPVQHFSMDESRVMIKLYDTLVYRVGEISHD
jgi:hypothetical protein